MLSVRSVLPVLVFVGVALLGSRAAGAADAPLTRAAAILALPSDVAAQNLHVVLDGVVTASEPDWEGRFFVQDASGGIFVVGDGRQPMVGVRVQVEGHTSPGRFAPIVTRANWTLQGRAELPVARATTADRLMGGAEDGQRVEITGLVRAAYPVPTRKLALDVTFAGHRVHVFPKLPPEVPPESLVGATVTVRGTVAASFNPRLRQLTDINLYVPTVDDLIIERPEARPPFAEPLLPLDQIARYHPDVHREQRVHVRGVVTFQRPGLDLFIQDQTGGLRLESNQNQRVEVGDTIDAVGFLGTAGYRPVLQDARCRRAEGPSVTPTPVEVTFAQLHDGLHANEVVRLRGRLVGRIVQPVRRDSVGFAGVRTICTIQNPELTFTTECEHNAENGALAAVPLGSLVATTGVAVIETGDDGRLRSLVLLQRTPHDLVVLETPSWFTASRLLIGLVIVLVFSFGGLVWSVTLTKKNTLLNFLVSERERAQQQLQQAHDTLEQRVQERTEQLQVAMTARKASEVEFKATLNERTRLARDLHDTLEQSLTGIALQLDTTARLIFRATAEAANHLELARGFMRQSRLELRQSIWNLRSRELERFDLATVLLHTSQQIAQGMELRIELEKEGTPPPLPEVVEENLLRIGQEAITNVVKHSGATLATITVAFTAEVVTLSIQDNGCGLVSERVADGAHHFGLLGISERSKRLGGRFAISSAPGEGTTVQVSLPLRQPEEASLVSL